MLKRLHLWPLRGRLVQLTQLRMEWKLIIIFVCLLIIPISLLSYYSDQNYVSSVQDNTSAYVQEVSKETANRLDEYIQDMEKLSTIPAYVDEIKENLELSNRYYESLESGQTGAPAASQSLTLSSVEIRQRIESSINFLNNIKEDTTSVYLFDQYGNAYYRYKSGVRQDIDKRYAVWKQAVGRDKGLPALIPTEEVVNNTNRRNYLFSVVREVFNNAYEPIGLIVVDANMDSFERFVKDMDEVTHGKTFIINKEDIVIYDSDRTFMTRKVEAGHWLQRGREPQGSFIEDVDGRESLVVYSVSERSGWRVVITVPLDELTQGVQRTREFTLFATLLTISLALVLSIFLSFALTRSLRKLLLLMKSVQQGNLEVSFPVTTQDEAGRLGNQFNRMIERIRQLIEENTRIGERKKEAELHALQSQINPHFIYNTLESIRMTAEFNDDDEVADMTEILGKLLRYSITDKKEFVQVEDELEHLRNYMKLQEFRYPGRFRLEIEPYGRYESLRMLKLTVQPIVENAILHGMNPSQTMVVSVSLALSGEDAVMVIKDNGVGMSGETLEKLRRSLSLPQAEGDRRDKRGIGLRNVNERLKLYYGEAYGLEVYSTEGEGTEVHVRLHRTWEQE
ncbi:cache domain-containing sensor histidine kinase [Paenibacillus mucilaginosus]|uniref:Integral membrane sensor signal transduction histidine kinase n=1 Tax=Paenibacillus mucilaginosus (strain KNP414) TaxID=1036673 RepID=F8F4V0_PAEMK|nr:sensor histidine kinase [Paenibacillus mucilaginosus]AEI40680.1 integral membrane sensor signal transduction histidine kinase [Paenibacillus mucilaginosus KNP414]MCG7211832.1 sensor histidine kinase [Paenibacillus mucilaginosus]WDM29819.1 sensor histidine kinase [Paenibacillus mucilaginosus]